MSHAFTTTAATRLVIERYAPDPSVANLPENGGGTPTGTRLLRKARRLWPQHTTWRSKTLVGPRPKAWKW